MLFGYAGGLKNKMKDRKIGMLKNKSIRLLHNKKTRFLQNKKADLSTVLLVFMTLFLVMVSLFAFITSENKVEKKLTYSGTLDKLYTQEVQLKFIVEKTLEDSLFNSYREITNVNAGDDELRQKILIRFGEKIKNYPGYYETESPVLAAFLAYHSNKAFNIILENGILKFSDENYLFNLSELDSSQRKILDVDYRSDLIVNVNLREKGLASFKSILEAAGSCRNDDVSMFEKCLQEKLDVFEFDVKKGSGFDIIARTKKYFLLDNNFKQIEVKFSIT